MRPDPPTPRGWAARFDRWLFEGYDATPAGLALARLAYALYALVVVTPGHGVGYDGRLFAQLPGTFFSPPPGPMQLLPGWPPEAVFAGLHLGLTASLVALALGWRTRLASLATAGLMAVFYGFLYAFGKVDHSILFWLTPLAMAFSGWGAALSLDARAGRAATPVRWPLAVLALVVGFGWGTAGLSKLLGGWLDPGTQGVLGHALRHLHAHGRADLLAPWGIAHLPRAAWEGFDVSTVLFEIGFLVAVPWPRVFRGFCAAAFVFHFGTALMLNIAFTILLPVYGVFLLAPLGAPRWLPRLWERTTATRARAAATAAALGLVGVLAPLRLLDGRFGWTSDLRPGDLLANALGLLAVAVAFALRLRDPAWRAAWRRPAPPRPGRPG